MRLRYGMNPHQKPASAVAPHGELPFEVLNGSPGYVNLLDALNSWQLVQELQEATGRIAAASFKHVSPAGVALAGAIEPDTTRACFVDDLDLSDAAMAYVKARGADRLSSFGDWAAVSSTVDASLARVLRREVSDGIIAPEYHPESLEILRSKRGGRYCILRAKRDHVPDEMETRQVFGVTLEQRRNDARISFDSLQDVVAGERTIPDEARRDLILGLITLKYTQSNSVCLVWDGQTIGVGAGQQSRIHCTKLAISKAQTWWLRRHPSVLSLRFQGSPLRPVRDNLITQYVSDPTPAERESWDDLLETTPPELTVEDREAWLRNMKGVSIASDGYFPFRDNIDRACAGGVQYIAQPGGSLRDDEVIGACNDHGVAMVFTGVRLFHH